MNGWYLLDFEEAKVQAEAYLKIVPDDVQMQELLETL